MINKVILTGRITADIELRRTNDGTPYAFFTLAVTRQTNRDQTDFISCVAWRSTSEFMEKYFSKGSLIGVEGRIEVYRVNKNGEYETRTNVNVSQVHFLESKNQQSQKRETTEMSYENESKPNMNLENNKSQFNNTNTEVDSKEEINFEDIEL